MKSWNECRDEVMAELELASDYNFNPKKIFDVYIYKGGKVVEVVKDAIVWPERFRASKDEKVEAALKKHDAKIYEAVCINELEVERAKYSREAIQRRAFHLWYDALRAEFSEVNEAVFDICYDQAYDRYHHASYDEVANGMHDIVYFAKQIIEASK